MGGRRVTIRWTPEADAILQAALPAGETLEAVGASLGVSGVAVMYRANALGISRRRRAKVSPGQVIALHSAGIHQSEIARMLGVTRQAISLIIKRALANGPAEGDGWRTVHCSGVSLGDVP